jgi:ABC-type multidrug transport system ATPase subunit
MESMNSGSDNSTCEVRHLSKRYDQHTVVDDLNFSIPAGHVVGLIGPNGAGKTTTMRMLLGLVRPSGGETNLLGRNVGAAGWGDALKRVGSMIEPPIYDRMTARQNLRHQALAVSGPVDDDEIDGLLKLADLLDRPAATRDSSPDGTPPRNGHDRARLGRALCCSRGRSHRIRAERRAAQ